MERTIISSDYVKAQVETNSTFGCAPESRSMMKLLQLGLLILDKPPNPTSHEVTAWVKKILHIPKAGHGGTLDPKVTGVLPIALGKGTKALQVLLPSRKEYICIMKLHNSIDPIKTQSVMQEFIGQIYQRPPLRSSVKRRIRVRTIHSISILEIKDNIVLFRVKCQAGTYIRKLCHDLGFAFGTGAHMKELRRTKTGLLSENEVITLNELQEAADSYFEDGEEKDLRKMIHPIEYLLASLPKITLRDSAVDAICHGAYVTVPGIVRLSKEIRENTLVVIQTLKREVIALGRSLLTAKEIFERNNGIAAKPTEVLMERGIYPRKW
ncbi:MAG: RNA-guided pseudouridylation complex pseudouridine synthase subunit Cbf5 [Promethearchaeota archaeon]